MSESNPAVILSHLNAAENEFDGYRHNGHREELIALIEKICEDQCGNCDRWVNECATRHYDPSTNRFYTMTCGGRVLR